MIKFQKVRFKNFGSFGNNTTEIVLDKNNTTLICGSNGSGKSFAFLDSITFALFGKPFRKINIPQLTNSINEKNCLVEIEFSKGSENFLVKRGINPRIFEIYKNGSLINQDAKSLDYQELLEQQILKMNYKTFTQVVILGSSSFVPFMQLSAADRRSVIENILDINIFSTMNVVLKGKILSLKENIKDVVTRIEIEKNKISVQTSLISTLEKKNKEDNVEKENKIKELEEKVNELTFKHLSHRSMSLEDDTGIAIVSIKHNKEKIKSLSKNISDIEALKNQKQSDIKFFQENHICPTCSQSIDEKVKKSKILSNNLDISNYNSSLDMAKSRVDELETLNSTIEENLENVKKELIEYKNELATIDAYKKEISKIQFSINKTSLVGDIQVEKEKLAHIQGCLETLETEKKEYSEDLMYHELASELMKDGGVKAKIIKYYLPFMNKHINRFLSAMDFFVQFNLDEEFNEQIKSRHRDEFSYMNFSEGEKMRIDLALLLAWREIARSKNSVNCNLLILDEVFDSSLDGVGMDELMKLLKVISDKANVYVISHKTDQLIDKFSNTITFEKKNNFSRMINN
jgi:DNA repair exonuclease SbcCD ATPase subunit